MRRALLALSTPVLLASCGGGGSDISAPPPAPPPPPPPASVATVTLSLTAATLVPSETRQITATTKDAAGNTLSGRTISWTTTAPNVATVTDGLVTGVAPGDATITATSEGQSATAAISVLDGGVASASGGTIVAASGKVSIVLPPGAVAAATPLRVAPLANPPSVGSVLSGTAYDFGPDGTQFAQAVTLRVTWDASALPQGADPSLLRLHVLENNAWTPIAGSSVDVAARTVSGATTHFSSYAIAAIQAAVASVEITPAGNFEAVTGDTRQLTATPKSATGQTLNRPVAWSTSSTSVATVSATGLVTAVGAGTATIRASSDDITASVDVTVTDPPPPGAAFTSVSVGYHICGVTAAGAASCWGRNDNGQLGDGTTTPRTHPVPVAGNKTWTQLTVGLYHTCGIASGGTVWCWGNNAEAELGDGSVLPKSQPVQVLGAPALVQISAGSLHTCGVTAGGQAYCWGDNRWGQLGDQSLTTRAQAVPVISDVLFTRVSAGQDRTCGVTPGHQVWCWGSNGGGINSAFPNDQTGILGIGVPNSPMTQPRQVVGNVQWNEVTAGYRFSCGRAADASVRCWGANVYAGSRGGMIGDGSLVTRQSPTLIATGAESWTDIGAGFYSACALSVAGDAWCWGTNYAGEVGDGGEAELASSTNHATPVKVTGGRKFARLFMAKLNACGLTQGGELWCWGSNINGQLGDGTTTNRATPVRVVP